MVIKLHNGTFVTQDMKDCLELVEPELAEAIKYYHEFGDELGLQQRFEDLEYEFKSYESSNESYRSCLTDVLESAEALKEYTNEAKKIDRQKIINVLDNIIRTISNEI